jgi:hypothetical protein
MKMGSRTGDADDLVREFGKRMASSLSNHNYRRDSDFSYIEITRMVLVG